MFAMLVLKDIHQQGSATSFTKAGMLKSSSISQSCFSILLNSNRWDSSVLHSPDEATLENHISKSMILIDEKFSLSPLFVEFLSTSVEFNFIFLGIKSGCFFSNNLKRDAADSLPIS